MKHLETSCGITFANNSLRISYEPPEDSVMIDLSTIQSVELIQNLRNVKSNDCLFGLLNNTLTPMGARILRRSILQPSTREEILLSRYQAVEELSTEGELFFALRGGKSRWIDGLSLSGLWLTICSSKGLP